ncbi:hypothetical protein V8C86DRAFT_1103017 [Haematococcus lacustris]
MIDVVNFVAMASTVTSQHFVDLHQTLEDAARAASRTSARVTASRRSAAAVKVAPMASDILSLVARCLPVYQAAVVAAVEKLTGLMQDRRCRPAVLRTGLRVATAAALAHNTMGSLLPYAGHMTRMPHTNSTRSLLPTTVQRLSEMEKTLIDMSFHVTHLWGLLLAQNERSTGYLRTDDDKYYLPSPSSPQLAPSALDLVLGMENTLQMVMRHQDMVWKWPFWNDPELVESLVHGYRNYLDLFGHAIEVLATPSVVGPAGLAAQPASWLPCGNSLVEGWCTRLLAGVCKLMCIATPASATIHVLLRMMLNERLHGSYKLLLRGQHQAPPSMSPEAERLLSCLTLVLTMALPLDTWLAVAPSLRGSYRLLLRGQRQAPPSMSPEAERLLSCLNLVLTAMVPQDLCLAMARDPTNPVTSLDKTLEEERRAMGVALSKLQPEHVWTWQALAAGTPAEATLQGLLPALASLFQVQGLVTPIEPGWRHQRLTLAMGKWHLS